MFYSNNIQNKFVYHINLIDEKFAKTLNKVNLLKRKLDCINLKRFLFIFNKLFFLHNE